ncbi:aminotransferase-like domain-containing protein [Blastopirellula marina]|uniref:Transcriptional regulator, GntR family/aminotransferase class-I n=1 Tax=Blastopirellula marina DSM 3645 TaxID=314230 RepID=A3ZT37_9BACT|nr:PLP-dependent aminotransferase family protein [Blastopirellula marina]EAQ80465.1 transcriptional regulator, GntR family/aminotransferase class-I [Blastopirellula marina DSM 3645]
MPDVAVPPSADEQRLYDRVAGHVARLIEQGTLRPGDRIPSVRRMRGQMSVSLSTVTHAYRLLESRGLIEARPKSGYFVRDAAIRVPLPPKASRSNIRPLRVNVARLSRRLQDVLASPEVVKLGAAVPDIELFPTQRLNRLFSQMLRRFPDLGHRYDVPLGYPPLRKEIARRMIDAGAEVAPADIVTTSGASEAVYLALHAALQPGDTVAVESPTYFGILDKLETLGLKAIEVASDPQTGVDVDAIERLAEEKRIQAAVIIANFNNPLGCRMPDAAKRRLVEIMSQHQLPLIEDDIFGELHFDSGVRPNALKAFDRDGIVLYCCSFSKTISPGMRVGWCAPGIYLESFLQAKIALNPAVSIAMQSAVAKYLEIGGFDLHLRRLRRTLQDRARQMAYSVHQHFPEETRATAPQGGQVLWLELPRGFDSVQLFEEAAERNISVAPGVLFSPGDRFRNFVRLNCAIQASDRVEQAIIELGRLAKRQLAT